MFELRDVVVTHSSSAARHTEKAVFFTLYTFTKHTELSSCRADRKGFGWCDSFLTVMEVPVWDTKEKTYAIRTRQVKRGV